MKWKPCGPVLTIPTHSWMRTFPILDPTEKLASTLELSWLAGARPCQGKRPPFTARAGTHLQGIRVRAPAEVAMVVAQRTSPWKKGESQTDLVPRTRTCQGKRSADVGWARSGGLLTSRPKWFRSSGSLLEGTVTRWQCFHPGYAILTTGSDSRTHELANCASLTTGGHFRTILIFRQNWQTASCEREREREMKKNTGKTLSPMVENARPTAYALRPLHIRSAHLRVRAAYALRTPS